MTVCWVLCSRLTYFLRNMNISSIFYFSKSTSINTQNSSLWDTPKMMLFSGKWAVAIDLNYQHGVNSGCTWAQKNTWKSSPRLLRGAPLQSAHNLPSTPPELLCICIVRVYTESYVDSQNSLFCLLTCNNDHNSLYMPILWYVIISPNLM